MQSDCARAAPSIGGRQQGLLRHSFHSWTLGLALVGLCFGVRSATPEGGTLSVQAQQLNYGGGPFDFENGTDQLGDGSTLQCSAFSPCDDYALSVVLPADFGATHPGAKIRVDLATDASSDYDLYILDDGGNYVAIAWNEGDSETVEFPAGSGSQAFTVRAVPFVGGGAYTATVSLVGGPAPADADGDGVPDSADFCPDTPPGTQVKPNGCPMESADTDGDGISDEDDLCPGTPAGTPVDANGCTAGLPEHLLYFHGNPAHDAANPNEPLCTGNASTDVAGVCDGPYLHPSAEMAEGPAGHWDGGPAPDGTADRNLYDPNFIWHLDAPVTVSGATVLQWWAACGACGDGVGNADWTIVVWADGTKKFEKVVRATPSLPNVPERLTASISLPEITASTSIVLHIDPVFVDTQQNTHIYYDSADACPGADAGPCDSRVMFNARDTDADGVPDLLDLCQGTPPGTIVDATGCPEVSACARDGAAIAQSGVPASGTITIDDAVRADWARLGTQAKYGAFVHFFRQGTRAQQDAVLRAAGLAIQHDFRRYGTFVFAQGPVAAFQALSASPLIMRIEHNRPLRYLDATQSWAMRARVAQERVGDGPYYDANGDVLTGKGVTLGIIDSGMFGAHPDYGGLDRIVHNYKLVSPVGGPMYYQDVGLGDSENGGGGHGTHVSGIVAGGGQQSNGGYPDPTVAPFVEGTFTSSAPESKIIHWGNGAVLFILSVELAYQHLLDNMALPEFATLRAVNNSYGDSDPDRAGGTPYNPNDSDKQLIRQIVGCGVSMVFAAGNEGGGGAGDGIADQTGSSCKDPTPGVICVASYNDQGTGTINGPLSGFSSRGQLGKPEEYPDIAAPGDLSTSTCAQATPTQAICTGGDDANAETEWQPWYGTISGTSMASPNVVSVIGLLAQANPSLTPAQIEQLLQRTARKIGSGYEPDPQNPGSTIHFGYGAGLVDLKAALDEMGIAKQGLPPVGEPWTIFADDADGTLAGAADIVDLVMQEYTDPDGAHGIEYRLAPRDLADFGPSSEIAYRVEQNVNGRHYETTILATPDGVTIPEPGAGNTAPAVSAGRISGTVVFRVPYTALGYPPVEAPIHNIAAFASDGSGTLDYAPSPPGSTGAQAPFQPMYGRPFTVRQAVPFLDTESVCVMPGKTRLLDDPGDQVQTPPGFEEQYDLLSVQIAEPGEGPLANKVVLTMKMRGFPGGVVPSGTRWAIRFNGPNPPPAGQDDFFIMMTTEESATPTFRYGTTGVTTDPSGTAGARTFQIAGDLDPASQFFEDGRIQLVLTRDNALIGPLEAGDALVKMFPAIRAPATPNNNAIYDQGGEFEHTLIDPATCVNLLPTAALSADVTSGDPPLTVTFDGSASVDPDADGEIVSYTFDFGDGSAPVTQAEPTVQHTYAAGGVFTASLVVQDKGSAVSTNPAEVEIRVEAPPVANAGADATAIEGTPWALDGSASSDANGDVLTFSWTQVSGPAVTLTGADTATPSFVAPEVCADDQVVFRLTVTDSTGLSSSDDVAVLIDNVNQPPVANAGADFSVKERRAVLLSAAASTDADCEALDYRWTQTGGPTVDLQGADTATAGFTAPAVASPTVLRFRITLEDPSGATSFDEVTVTVEDDPVIGDNAVGGLSWWLLAGLGLGGWLRRRRGGRPLPANRGVADAIFPAPRGRA